MAHADYKGVLGVDKNKLFDAIVRYEDYPQFVDGCTGVKVERKSAGHARVTYQMSLMKDFSYTIDLEEDREKGTVSWKLVESDLFKTNNGGWKIKESAAGKVDVEYEVEVDFKIPVPGFILNRLVKGSLPAMIKGFEKQARKL